jgi:hypothetical protein
MEKLFTFFTNPINTAIRLVKVQILTFYIFYIFYNVDYHLFIIIIYIIYLKNSVVKNVNFVKTTFYTSSPYQHWFVKNVKKIECFSKISIFHIKHGPGYPVSLQAIAKGFPSSLALATPAFIN